MSQKLKTKTREWLHRYLWAETLGTALSLITAWLVFGQTRSFVAAAGAGWAAEGFGFYGYFVAAELLSNVQRYHGYPLFRRMSVAVAKASTNLLVEFAPAEILDNFLIRPLALYAFPQFIHPYPIGFLAGKLSADIVFYLFAIVGYEARKRWLH